MLPRGPQEAPKRPQRGSQEAPKRLPRCPERAMRVPDVLGVGRIWRQENGGEAIAGRSSWARVLFGPAQRIRAEVMVSSQEMAMVEWPVCQGVVLKAHMGNSNGKPR